MVLKTLDQSTPVVKADLTPTLALQLFSEELANMQLIIGAGSPEGIYKARQGRCYMDQSGSTGSIKWIKKLSDIDGDQSMGWILE